VGPLGAVAGEPSDHAEAVAIEAISNVVRHSGATRVTVTVRVGDDLSLVVTDNGCGTTADNRRSSGLGNMRRRAELLGGRGDISATPDRGTTVQWTVPVFTE
jgi:signal transduction histidine kinase